MMTVETLNDNRTLRAEIVRNAQRFADSWTYEHTVAMGRRELRKMLDQPGSPPDIHAHRRDERRNARPTEKLTYRDERSRRDTRGAQLTRPDEADTYSSAV